MFTFLETTQMLLDDGQVTTPSLKPRTVTVHGRTIPLDRQT